MSQKPQNQDTSSLQDFKFDEDVSFFGITTGTETEEEEEVIKGVQNEEGEGASNGESKTKKKKEDDEDLEEGIEDEEEEDEITFFGEENEGEEKEEKEQPKKRKKEVENKEGVEEEQEKSKGKTESKKEAEEEGEDKFFHTLASELKEKGVFQNIEIKEGEEIDEDKFFELQEKEIEARVDETFEAFFEELDPDAREFLKFKKNGGKTSEFFHIYNNRGFDIDDFDPENESQRLKVITNYLTTIEGLDSEEVQDKIEWLKEGGKEKAYATKYFEKIKANREALKKAALKAQEDAVAQREEDAKAFNTSLSEILNKTESVGAFSITKADQKELGNYITKPSVKVGKSKYVPQFQAEVAKIFKAESEDDKKKLLLLAKLVKNDFDVSDLVKETKTKVTKEVKSKLQEAKSGIKAKSTKEPGRKSLGDYF